MKKGAINFLDIRETPVPERKRILRWKWFKALEKNVGKYDHYTVRGTIAKILTPDGKDFTSEPVFAVIGYFVKELQH